MVEKYFFKIEPQSLFQSSIGIILFQIGVNHFKYKHVNLKTCIISKSLFNVKELL
jgi:hypothetical protein